ncbi:MAG: DUF166 domain-containing protein [Archaeoglobaceae archaeon]|nr:DUF166 domain-containing protein [Archaeoglobaceae archaeon]MDW8118369.1 DUF166 domain-containing protein [Archaeoglobaceae archaeon]
MQVGVVVRRGKNRRAIDLFSKFFEVKVYEVEKELPTIIEDPREYLNLPKDFKPDLVISYLLHPDLNLELIRQASERGIKLLVISGGAKGGSYKQLKEEGEKFGVKVFWEEICCTTPKIKDSEFFELFGSPEFEIELENDLIKDVKVKRSSFCGSTYYVAEKIKGLRFEEAPSKAGYYTQIFPCIASRGLQGGIHKAANAHKKAVEKAIEESLKRSKSSGQN